MKKKLSFHEVGKKIVISSERITIFPCSLVLKCEVVFNKLGDNPNILKKVDDENHL